MVYGPGRYRFADFLKVGSLLTVLIFIVAILLVPRVWPLKLNTVTAPPKGVVIQMPISFPTGETPYSPATGSGLWVVAWKP